MKDKDWNICIKHIWWEGNRTANICANLGHFYQEGLVLFKDIPQELFRVIQEDAYGLVCLWHVSS